MRGVKSHPAYQKTDLDDPKYLRILERAGALGLIVVTHAGYGIGFPGCACCTPEKARSALRQVGPVKLVLALLGAGAGTAGRYVCLSPAKKKPPSSAATPNASSASDLTILNCSLESRSFPYTAGAAQGGRLLFCFSGWSRCC